MKLVDKRRGAVRKWFPVGAQVAQYEVLAQPPQDQAGVLGAEDLMYRVRRVCCDTEAEVSQAALSRLRGRPTRQCMACYMASHRDPRPEGERPAARPTAAPARPSGAAGPPAERTAEPPAPAPLSAQERRAQTVLRLQRIAAGLLPTPPEGPVKSAADLLRRQRERDALARLAREQATARQGGAL